MRASGEKGFAMIIVLWVAALLMAIVPAFVYSMRTESGAALNTADSAVARGLALSGVEMAVREIRGGFALVAAGGGGVVFMERYGSGFKPMPSDRSFELGGGTVSYTVEDERGRININTAERPVLDALLRLSGVEGPQRDVVTDSILDWRDGNHDFHLNGAEDDYYASLPSPYGAKDGPAYFKEELLLVKGVTPAVFKGSGRYSGIDNDITVHGDGRLNINTASAKALEAFYGKNIAGEIILKRQSGGYIAIPQNNGLVSSDTFTIESIGEYRSMRYRVEAVVTKKGATGVHYVSWRDWGVWP
jgi:general secretion pathway protein K